MRKYIVKITYTGVNWTKRDFLWWNCSYFAAGNFIYSCPSICNDGQILI